MSELLFECLFGSVFVQTTVNVQKCKGLAIFETIDVILKKKLPELHKQVIPKTMDNPRLVDALIITFLNSKTKLLFPLNLI